MTVGSLGRIPVRTREDFLVFGSPDIGEAEIEAVVASLRSGWLGTGPRVAEFEAAFAAYKQAPHAVAVNSCTADVIAAVRRTLNR